MSIATRKASQSSSALLPSPCPLWQLNLSDGSTAAGDCLLSGPWRLLLLGDGSPTRHLESLTGKPVEIELIAMAP